LVAKSLLGVDKLHFVLWDTVTLSHTVYT